MADTYSVNVECNNCDHVGEIRMPKGEPINTTVECPNCGCKTAYKRHKMKIDSKVGGWHYPPGWPYTLVTSPVTEQKSYPFDVKCRDDSYE